jgi:hypothetical protein
MPLIQFGVYVNDCPNSPEGFGRVFAVGICGIEITTQQEREVDSTIMSGVN